MIGKHEESNGEYDHLGTKQSNAGQSNGPRIHAGDAGSDAAFDDPPAGAAVPTGRAFAWGDNFYGQLGNGASDDGTERDVPLRVKNLTNVKNIDGGFYFTLDATR